MLDPIKLALEEAPIKLNKRKPVWQQLEDLKLWSQNPEAYYAKEKKKIVKVEKSKPEKPKPKPIEIDYDWRLAPWQDYPEDDDIKKLVSQPSLEESNATYWEN